MCPILVWGGVKLTSGDFIFSGWNTEPDGSGVQYNERDALDAIGRDSGVSDLTLYANWKTKITFDANGGTLAGGTTTDEKALAGSASGTIMVSCNATISTGLIAEKTNNHFIDWNTKPDATGISIEDFGNVTSPVTFYAVYYQSEFPYTGSVQEFIAPVNGIYEMTCFGAEGGTEGLGGDNSGKSYNGIRLTTAGGKGGMTTGQIYLEAGTKLYVVVGQKGSQKNGSYNGGGAGRSASGGGATDIRISSTDLNSRIMVAGGGGGGGKWGNGGAGGSITSGKGFFFEHESSPVIIRGITYTAAATQSSGKSFGSGASSGSSGGGGGGWYGGFVSYDRGSGSGGSSYISGYSLCNGTQTTATEFQFTNASMQQGVRSGDGYAQILLLTN